MNEGIIDEAKFRACLFSRTLPAKTPQIRVDWVEKELFDASFVL
jgi:hypothetical protein